MEEIQSKSCSFWMQLQGLDKHSLLSRTQEKQRIIWNLHERKWNTVSFPLPKMFFSTIRYWEELYNLWIYIYVLEHYISTWKDVEITLDKHLFPHHINKSGVPKEKK